MTQLLPHLSQTSLGETCASYLDYITASLPSLHHKLSSFPSVTPLSLTSPPDWASSYYRAFVADNDNISKAPAVFTLVACAIVLVIMSWRNLFRRSSPTYQNVPAASNDRRDRPYTYLTPDDIVDSPARTYDDSTYNVKRRGQDDDTEPDKLLLNHRRVTYELHFPPYSINDGTLSIGQLRQSAAEVTNTADPNRIRLLYKGKLLDNDALPCRAEGLKQESEVLCVVSEVQPGVRTPSDASDIERISSENARPRSQDLAEPKPGKKSKSKKKKSKSKKKKPVDEFDDDEDDDSTVPAPANPTSHPPQPARQPASSTMPPPAPNLRSFATALEQVNALTAYFRKELVPLCEKYIANPPTDAKSRDFEHKRLGETILAQVMLKADGIEPTDDETRSARRALIKETQTILSKVDMVARN